MKSINRIWQIAAVGVVVLVMTRLPLARATTNTVEFNYNGIRWVSQTTAYDVAEALIENLGDYSHLQVTPHPSTPIEGYTTIEITDDNRQTLNTAVSENLELTIAALEEEVRAEEEAKKEASTPQSVPISTPPEPAPESVVPEPTPESAPPEPTPAPPSATAIYSGLATWYRHGDGLTTASRDFPKGTHLRVIAVNSGRSVDVVVDDYGPSAATGIALDLNLPAFEALAPAGAGKIQIKYHEL